MYTRLGQSEANAQEQAAQNKVPDWASGLTSVLTPLAQAGAQIYQAKSLADINKERAKAGLPPLNAVPAGPIDSVGNPIQQQGGTSPLLVLAIIAAIGGGIWFFLSKKK